MRVRIFPSTLCGEVAAPPSKSFSHRLLIAAALADGESSVSGIADSEDLLATLDCLSALGVQYTRRGDTVSFLGTCGTPTMHFPCRESGSTLRFFLPISLALGNGGCFTGSTRLMQRGIGIYEELFRRVGIALSETDGAITVRGHLPAGEYVLRGDVSSQFVTGLLYALPLLAEDSTVRVLPPVESRPYIDMTLSVLRSCGISVTEPTPNTFSLRGGQRYRAGTYRVEGDWSNAAFFYAMSLFCGKLTVTGLNPDSLQGDRVCAALFDQLLQSPQTPMDISACPDLGPVLFAVAAAGRGGRFIGTRRLRIKESDRAQAMADELKKFGIDVTLSENSVEIHGGTLKPPTAPLNAHNDHRIVMALTVLAAQVGGTIEGAEAVAKSYPTFFKTLDALGLEAIYEL